jgi:colanic acid/amylovoran biosynthesis glycosyltransferase
MIGYVVKRYPRLSETFIVNEILAHEAAGLAIEIFSLYPTIDTHFQDNLARVRAPVRYLPGEGSKVAAFWAALCENAKSLPGFWSHLEACSQREQAYPGALASSATGSPARAASGAAHEVRDLFQAVALARYVRGQAITHLHAHFASAPCTVARLAARFAGIPYSFTAHAKDIFHESVCVEDLGGKIADASAVVTVSDFNVEHLQGQFPQSAPKIRRIYNGLELDRFPYIDPKARPRNIVAIGRLVEKKGFADLVEACALLEKKQCAFTCTIVGDGELDGALRELIGKHGLSTKVRMAGACPQSEAIRHIQNAAVLVAPCVVAADGNRDGLPTVLLEGMALGTPCISTDVTGIPEVLRDGETGLMTPQHDPVALAQRIAKLLDDAPLRCKLASQARQLIEQDFDIHANAARLRKLFSTEACSQREQAHLGGPVRAVSGAPPSVAP